MSKPAKQSSAKKDDNKTPPKTDADKGDGWTLADVKVNGKSISDEGIQAVASAMTGNTDGNKDLAPIDADAEIVEKMVDDKLANDEPSIPDTSQVLAISLKGKVSGRLTIDLSKQQKTVISAMVDEAGLGKLATELKIDDLPNLIDRLLLDVNKAYNQRKRDYIAQLNLPL